MISMNSQALHLKSLSNYAFTVCGRTPYPDTDSTAVCICGAQVIEDLHHYLLPCSLSSEVRAKFISYLLEDIPDKSDQTKIIYLLSYVNKAVTESSKIWSSCLKVERRF